MFSKLSPANRIDVACEKCGYGCDHPYLDYLRREWLNPHNTCDMLYFDMQADVTTTIYVEMDIITAIYLPVDIEVSAQLVAGTNTVIVSNYTRDDGRCVESILEEANRLPRYIEWWQKNPFGLSVGGGRTEMHRQVQYERHDDFYPCLPVGRLVDRFTIESTRSCDIGIERWGLQTPYTGAHFAVWYPSLDCDHRPPLPVGLKSPLSDVLAKTCGGAACRAPRAVLVDWVPQGL